MTLTVFIFLIALAFTFYQLGAIYLNHRFIKRMRDLRGRTETQLAFGKLRHELMRAMSEEEVAPGSITFLYFYGLYTSVMRNPDKYKDLAAALRDNFLDDIHDSHSRSVIEGLNNEKDAWTPAVRKMVADSSDQLTLLMVRHSPFLRTLLMFLRLCKRVLAVVLKREISTLRRGFQMIASVNSTNRAFVETSSELKHLAAA